MRPLLRLLALLPLIALLAGCGEPAPRLGRGDPPPPFTTTTSDGAPFALADTAGQVVAIRFWADWCPYCEEEMRAIEPIHRELSARGLRVVAVNVGQDRETIRRFLAKLGVSYPALLDPDSQVARAYGVIGLPTTFFVDRQGKIHAKILGESDAATFRRIVEGLL